MELKKVFHEACLILAVGIWVSSFFVSLFLIVTAFFWPLLSPSWTSILYTCLVVFLTIGPVFISSWSKNLVLVAIKAGIEYFSVKVRVKDEAALKAKQPYLIGFEPHSAIPVAMPIVLNDLSPLLPSQLQGLHGVSSTMCFHVPLVRQLWWWLGLRPASKVSIQSILQSGKSAVLVPGGVREIHCIEEGKEVLFLKERRGFIKLALQTGCPLLPVFAFGQTSTYSARPIGPPLVPRIAANALGRMTGVQPTFMFGRWGTTIPKKVPMFITVGTPIEVPKIADPEDEVVQTYLQKFIDSMSELFEECKAEAGYPDLTLEIL